MLLREMGCLENSPPIMGTHDHSARSGAVASFTKCRRAVLGRHQHTFTPPRGERVVGRSAVDLVGTGGQFGYRDHVREPYVFVHAVIRFDASTSTGDAAAKGSAFTRRREPDHRVACGLSTCSSAADATSSRNVHLGHVAVWHPRYLKFSSRLGSHQVSTVIPGSHDLVGRL